MKFKVKVQMFCHRQDNILVATECFSSKKDNFLARICYGNSLILSPPPYNSHSCGSIIKTIFGLKISKKKSVKRLWVILPCFIEVGIVAFFPFPSFSLQTSYRMLLDLYTLILNCTRCRSVSWLVFSFFFP